MYTDILGEALYYHTPPNPKGESGDVASSSKCKWDAVPYAIGSMCGSLVANTSQSAVILGPGSLQLLEYVALAIYSGSNADALLCTKAV